MSKKEKILLFRLQDSFNSYILTITFIFGIVTLWSFFPKWGVFYGLILGILIFSLGYFFNKFNNAKIDYARHLEMPVNRFVVHCLSLFGLVIMSFGIFIILNILQIVFRTQ